jgi:hypothetical protein
MLVLNVILIVLLAKILQSFHVILVNQIHQKNTYIRVNAYLFAHKIILIKNQITLVNVNKINIYHNNLKFILIFFLKLECSQLC